MKLSFPVYVLGSRQQQSFSSRAAPSCACHLARTHGRRCDGPLAVYDSCRTDLKTERPTYITRLTAQRRRCCRHLHLDGAVHVVVFLRAGDDETDSLFDRIELEAPSKFPLVPSERAAVTAGLINVMRMMTWSVRVTTTLLSLFPGQRQNRRNTIHFWSSMHPVNPATMHPRAQCERPKHASSFATQLSC